MGAITIHGIANTYIVANGIVMAQKMGEWKNQKILKLSLIEMTILRRLAQNLQFSISE